MFAAVERAVVRGIILNYLDVAGQTRAGVSSFDEIVAEQSIAREAAVKDTVHGINFVDSLAGKAAFAIQILIRIGDSPSIDVESSLTRVDGGQPGVGGA